MIVSIYIKEHEYLTQEPQTINFGGKYLYSYEQGLNDNLFVRRELNQKFIPEFFNISESACHVQLLSAVVGQNGVGKSTILDIIRSAFVKHSSSMPDNNCVILLEIEGETWVLQSGNSRVHLQVEVDDEIEFIDIPHIDKANYQSIYYSPHLDLKYNNNFSEVDNYDISLDQFIKDDLELSNKKGTNENGWKFHLHEELVLKNAIRQVEFLDSTIFRDNLVFRNVFNLPEYETGILHFRDVEIPDFWNTPISLQPIIKLILKKIEDESSKWHVFRDNNLKLNESLRQALVNRYLLERFVLKAFISIIIEQMEKSNTWLREGNIEDSYDGDKFAEYSANDLFHYFLKESFIKRGDLTFPIFKYEEILSFFAKLNFLIEKETNPNDIKKQSIRLRLSEVKEMLQLHKKIIINLLDYYPKYENLVEKSNYTDGFISFRPTDRNMSSGENALLNFFSKLYNFIENNLIEESKSLPDKEFYVLLLDEADLGFHPVWKKRFIDAILKTLPYFFENLAVKPSLQIVITTHDPLTLSDIPINNVAFLYSEGGYCKVMIDNHKNKIQKTFGANITNLLSHSFFIEDGLIGDFAKAKIKEVIDWINSHKKSSVEKKSTPLFLEQLAYYKKVVSLIDEKVIKIKLSEMITELVPDDAYYNQIIDKEINFLSSKKR